MFQNYRELLAQVKASQVDGTDDNPHQQTGNVNVEVVDAVPEANAGEVLAV